MNFQLRWILLLGVVGFCISILHSAGEKSLWSIQQTLSSKRYVDLTHAFEPGIPATAGSPVRTRASDQHIFSKTTSAEYSRAIFHQRYAKSRCKTRRHRAKVSIAAESSLRFVNRCRSNKPTTSNNA